VIDTPHVDWFALAPVLSLLAGAAVALLAAVLVPASIRRATAAGAAGLGYAGAIVFGVLLYTHSKDPSIVAGGGLSRDRLYACAAVLIGGIGIATVLLAARDRMRDDHIAEYFSLLAVAGAGMVFFVGSSNLMTLFLALEWFSISLYILCAIDGDNPSGLEAGLKYLVTGGFGSAILLFGSALVYGATGELSFDKIAAAGHTHDSLLVLGLAMMIAGFAFKASAAPFHMWTPDAYQGAPTPVTAFMSSATKVAALFVTYRVLATAFPHDQSLWRYAIAVIACISLAWGNIAALVQRNVKRILAYSSVSHAGFMLIAVAAASQLGARALAFYVVPYAAMSLGSFAIVAARERELGVPVTLENLAGFGWERPFLGVAMWVFMLGFLGFPLTGGFIGKFYVFAAAYDSGMWWLIVAGVIATMISAYYYLGVVRAMYFRDAAELQLAPAGGSPPRELVLGAAVAICLVVTVGSFFAVQPLIDVATSAARALPI
jgi:NADH-quinone oxidoreductase subunit N